MAEGIRALMELATESQDMLPFRIALFAGGAVVSGIVAPWWVMSDVTASSAHQQVEEAFKRTKDEKERLALLERHAGPVKEIFTKVRKREENIVQDEVTLYDAAIYTAADAAGIRNAGLSLPVVRVPLASINAWWVMEGNPIKGSGSGFIGFVGVSIPIGN